MKICLVCKEEIKPNQSYRATGLGYVHLRCVFQKAMKVMQGTNKKARRPQD